MKQERALGCLAGLAIGDAMGMPTEFLTPEEIELHFGWVSDFVQSPPWHPHAIFPAGRVTDDTGQALAIVSAYESDGELLPKRVADALLAWADSLPEKQLAVLIGPGTRKALDELHRGVDPRDSGTSGKTNGAAMRAMPVGLVNSGDWAGATLDAVLASMPTHNTRSAISGAAAVAAAIAEASREGADLESILAAGKLGAREGRKSGGWVWSTPLEGRIELAEVLVREAANEQDALRRLYEYVGVDMLVPESVATAFGLVLLAEGDPMRAIRMAANLGGDSDTIGAIAGSICGAWRGVSAVDPNFLARVERVNGLDLAAAAERLVEIYHCKHAGGTEK